MTLLTNLLIVLIGLSFVDTAEAANCPVRAFVAQSAGESFLFYNDSTLAYSFVDTDGDWLATPYTTLPSTAGWTDDYTAVGTTSTSAEWTIGVLNDGTLASFGSSNVTTSVPSGAAPYSSPKSGSTGSFVALDNTGAVKVWGNTASGFGTVPSGTGYTAVDAGRNLGCAVSDTSSVGVTCWGDNTEGLVTHASRPTTGTYKSVAVGRYVVAYVDTSGNTGGFGTTRVASGMTTKAAQFIANMPTSGVESLVVNETGELIGVAWMMDGTVRVWQDSGTTLRTALKSAPGFSVYGSTSDRIYTPQGPSGALTFRSQPEIDIYGSTSPIAAVVDNPQGLVEGTHTYAFGEAIRWDSTTTLYGGIPNYWPRVIDACD